MSPAVAGLATLLAQAAAVPGAAGSAPPERLAAVNDPLLQAPAPARETLTSFDQALRRLRAGSDTLAIAAARADAAAAQSREALAPLLPQLAATASVNVDLLHPRDPPPVAGAGPGSDGAGVRVGPTSPLGVGTLAVAVPLVDVSQWQARAAARAGADAARASLADTQRVLVFQLASTLVNVAAAERTAELQREGLRNALEREYLVKRTRDLGTGTGLDLVRAQQDTRLARADVIAGREQLLQAREALGLLLGQATPVGVRAAELESGTLEDAARRVCRVTSPGARPDVLAARLQLRAAEERIDEARADYAPTLSLQSSTSVYTVDPGTLRMPAWLLAAVLSVPLWDGGGRGARLDARQAEARAAVSDAEAVGREAAVDQSRSARGVSVARDLLAEAQGARDLAREADRMTRRSFEVGVATSFELVQSAQALRQAELALAAREFQLVTARVAAVVSEATCNIR